MEEPPTTVKKSTSVKKSPSFKAESETQTSVAVRVPSLKKKQVTDPALERNLDRLITAEQTQNASVARRRRIITKNKAQNVRTREKTPEPNRTPVGQYDDTTTTDEEDKVPKSPLEKEADDIYAEMKKKLQEQKQIEKDKDDIDIGAIREAQIEEARERRRRSISPFALPSKEDIANLQRKGSFIDPGNKLLTTVPSYPMSPKDEINRKDSLIVNEDSPGRKSSITPPPSPGLSAQRPTNFQLSTPPPPKNKPETTVPPTSPKTLEKTQEAPKPTQQPPKPTKQIIPSSQTKPKPCLKTTTNATERNNAPVTKEPIKQEAPPVRPKRSKSGTRSQGRTSESEMSEGENRRHISRRTQAEPPKPPKPTKRERRKTIAEVKRKEPEPPVPAKRSKSVTRTQPNLNVSGIEMTKTSSEIIELLQKARKRSIPLPDEDEKISNAVRAYVDRSRHLMTPTRLPSSPRRGSRVTSHKTIEILSDKEARETLMQVHRKSVEMERTRRNSGYIDASQSEITSSCYSSSYSEDDSDFDLSKKTAELSRKLALLKSDKDVKKKDEVKIVTKEDDVKKSSGMLRNCRPVWRKFRVEQDQQYWKIRGLWNRCFSDLVLLIILCGVGGLVFRYTEGAFENFYKCGVKRVKRDFIDSLWQGSHNMREDDWKSMARKKLWEFETQLHTAHEAGVHSYSGQKAWSFMNSFVYCLTVITTIGYGHIAPSTTTGRAITIVYAIFGIPLFLILLADFGKLFTRGIKFLWVFVRRLYYTGSCRKVRTTVPVQEVMKGLNLVYEAASTFRRPSQYAVNEVIDPDQPPKLPPKPKSTSSNLLSVPDGSEKHEPLENDEPQTPALSVFEIDDEFNLPISVAIFILIGYIFVGASVYVFWEEWGFFESFYFVFISMSTIGFGDYVPNHPMYMMLSIVYLVFGLALTSMCINVVQAKLSDSFRQASAKIGATIGLKVSEEDGSLAPVTPPPVEMPPVHATQKTPEIEEAPSK